METIRPAGFSRFSGIVISGLHRQLQDLPVKMGWPPARLQRTLLAACSPDDVEIRFHDISWCRQSARATCIQSLKSNPRIPVFSPADVADAEP